MRFSCLTIAIACITGQILLTSASAYELDNNEGIDIRGPGGVYRPSVVSTSHVNKKKLSIRIRELKVRELKIVNLNQLSKF